jgi:hypothetical protein
LRAIRERCAKVRPALAIRAALRLLAPFFRRARYALCLDVKTNPYLPPRALTTANHLRDLRYPRQRPPEQVRGPFAVVVRYLSETRMPHSR